MPRRARCAIAAAPARPARRCATGPSAKAPGPSNATLHRLRLGAGRRWSARGCERPERGERMLFSRLPQWEEAAERPPPRTVDRSRRRCARAARRADRRGAEPREGQRAMAARGGRGLRARAGRAARRNMLLAEAGTGIGKTLGLSRAGLAVGRASRAARCGSRPSPRRCSASSTREGRAARSPTPSERAKRIVVRKGRENYLCLLNLEDALQGGFAGRAAILAQLVARWAAYTQGRRHGRRRPARLAAEPVPPRRRDRADRPARRMRLCRLPALPELLHRARRAGQPRGRPRHRQPRAGDGQRRARRATTRRRGSCSTRAITCSMPPIRPSPPRSTGQEAIEMRRWIVGPGRHVARAAARPRGAADGRRHL